MPVETSVTETVVRNHLEALLQQKGVAAIVSDYDEEARVIGEDTIYRGKQQIHGFFENFIAALPVGAVDRFTLRSLWVDRDLAYITWSVGGDVPGWAPTPSSSTTARSLRRRSRCTRRRPRSIE